MSTASRAIDIAEGQLGVTDGTKYGKWYAKKVGNGYFAEKGVPWCAMFVSWVLDKAGVRCAGIPGASCSAVVKAARKAGATVSSAKPGDLVIFDWDPAKADGPDHIGLVVDIEGSYVNTIEGNTGGAVKRRTRALRWVYAIVRPQYSEESSVGRYLPLVVDGIAAKRTIWTWQEVMGSAYVDGWISGQWYDNRKWFPAIRNVTYEDTGESMLVKLVQHALGLEADGYMGPDFARGVNGHLGLDGDTIDSRCVRALQARLNEFKF